MYGGRNPLPEEGRVIAQTFRKDPDAKLDFAFDWREKGWLASGEDLSAVTWTVPAGLTEEATTMTDDVAAIWLSGGTAGSTYAVSCRITTSDGRIDERSFAVIVEER